MNEAVFMDGVAVGAVAGAIATILLAPKSGRQMPGKTNAHLDEIRDEIARQLEKTEKLTRRKYEEVVKAVVAEHEATARVSREEAKEIEARLHDGYEAVKGTIERHAGRGRRPVADQ